MRGARFKLGLISLLVSNLFLLSPIPAANAALGTNSSSVTNLTTGITGLSGANFRDIATTPNGNTVVAVVDLGDIFLSSDTGTTWSNLTTSTSLSGLAWRSVAVSANGQIIFAAVYGGDIYKSSNGGTTWASVTSTTGHNLNWTSLSISDAGDRVFASATGNYIYISQNGGTTWQVQRPLPPGYPDVTRPYVAISTNSGGDKFVATPGGLNSIITSLTPDTTTSEFDGSAFTFVDGVMSRDGTRIYTMGPSDVYKLQMWSRVAGITSYYQYASMDCYLNGCPGGNFIATNGDGRVVMYGGSTTKLMVSTDTGYSYKTLTNSPTADWRGVAFNASGSIAFAIAYGGDIYRIALDPSTFVFGTVFHATGGSGYCNYPLLGNGDIALLNTSQCTRSGYVLKYWKINGVNYLPGDTFTVTSQTNAEAQWVPSYTLTYSGNVQSSGSAPNTITVESGTAVTLASNTGNLLKTGFVFNGWNTLSSGLGVNYAVGSSYLMTASTTLYASWANGLNTPVTLANITNASYYRISINIVATVQQPGLITFFANNKRIPNCISKPITTTFTCAWKPSKHGGVLITAKLKPTDTAYGLSTSNVVTVGNIARDNLR